MILHSVGNPKFIINYLKTSSNLLISNISILLFTISGEIYFFFNIEILDQQNK